MKKKGLVLMLTLAMLVGCVSGAITHISHAADDSAARKIEGSNIPLHLYYDEEASHGIDTEYETRPSNMVGPNNTLTGNANDDWERWSIPVGNGYFGANLFGRTDIDRIQITEKSLQHPGGGNNASLGGLNNFSETYIDIGHKSENVSEYSRRLDLSTAVSTVSYTHAGVKYTREYFTSYPDKALVIRLDADTAGALSFTLRPTVPYEQDYAKTEGDGASKTGTVVSSVANGVGNVVLSGTMGYYGVDFVGIYKVYTNGGSVTAGTTEHTYTDTAGISHTDIDGTISVAGATSAYIVVTLGTDYELSSEMFTASDADKPTKKTTLEDAYEKVSGYMSALEEKHISGKNFDESYESIKNAHISDHGALFNRVTLDLDCDESDYSLTTDALMEKYRTEGSTYLELLMFQYGRYLLIASSRENTLPANLQGAWNRYNLPPWGVGYWHNINVQMNYWPAFSTNLAETFDAYVDYNAAYMALAERLTDSLVERYNPEVSGTDGGNGWAIGVGATPYKVASDRSSGNLGFTTQLFWDYYRYTKDEAILETVYGVLANAARYITKCVVEDEAGNLLVEYCDSPEQYVNGVWYYTQGTTYAQTFAYLNNYNALLAASELGIDLGNEELLSTEEYSILKTVTEQLDRYDPINVGLSGQIKEFREEDYYGSVGDPDHRHISQLVGLYPGNLINSTTSAWFDAAKVTLEGRSGSDGNGGWVYAHKMALYARAKDGDNALKNLNGLLSTSTGTNLLTLLWNVFQIDANFGATAGVSEMLLQSHEGYIEPLAALPALWSSGSYTGLVAEGNFEVSAAWESGMATTVNILSKSGGRASVYYPNVSKATVIKLSDGSAVNVTKDAINLISFDTEVGETYAIYGFTAQEKPASPKNFDYARAGLGAFKLEWSAVSGADKYNVYCATENQSSYTLLGSTKNAYFNYTPNEQNANARVTFALTAVSSDGVESDRALVYSNPIDTSAKILDAHGSLNDGGILQVTVNANDYAIKYRLYEKTGGSDSYTLISESGFPLLGGTSYNKSSTYAVSAVSYFDGSESELFVIKRFGNYDTVYDATNVLAGKQFVPSTSEAASKVMTNYGYDLLTDGIIDTKNVHNGRFSSAKNGMADGTVDLGGSYILSEIRFYDFSQNASNAGADLKIQVLSEGTWVTVVNAVSSAEIAKHRVSIGSGGGNGWLAFDLGAIRGEKIRFSISAPAATDSYITFYEIRCSGVRDELINATSENIFKDKIFVPTEEANDDINSSNYGYGCLTDGVADPSQQHVGRFSTKKNGIVDATMDLGGSYLISEIRLYDFSQNVANAGETLEIQVCSGGKWITVAACATNAEIASHRVSIGSGGMNGWLAFDIGYVRCQRVRIAITPKTDGYITFYEIEASGMRDERVGELQENILTGKEFVPTEETKSQVAGSAYNHAKLTDGIADAINIHSGRYSSSKGGKLDATLDLEQEYLLTEFRFYDYSQNVNNAGQSLTIQTYYNGVWTTVCECATNAEIASHRVSIGSGGMNGWLAFDIGYVRAEKIRLYVTNKTDSYITFYEVECSGYALDAVSSDITNENALLGLDASLSSGTALGGSAVKNVLDGNTDTYLEVSDTDGSFTLEIDLKLSQTVYYLKIYEQLDSTNLIGGVLSTASDKTTVEVWRDSAWIKIADGVSLRADKEYTLIDLCGTECEKIRITFKNTRLFDGQSDCKAAKIREIECTSAYKSIDYTALIDALKKLPVADVEDDANNVYLYNESYLKFKGYIQNASASQADIDAYTEEVKQYFADVTSATLSAYNISLGGDISMNFRFKLVSGDTLTLYPNAYVEFTVPTKDGSELRRVYLKDAALDSQGRYIFTVALAASQMNDKLALRLVYTDEISGPVYKTSVRDYADYVLSNPTIEEAYPGVSALLLAMLNYGGYAQSYFGYNTDSLASDGLYTPDTDPVLNSEISETSAVVADGKADGANLYGWTLLLNSRTDICVYFTLDGSYRISDYTATLDGDGTAVPVAIIKDGERYKVKITDIGAPMLDNVYTLTLTNTANDSSVSVSLSALCYVSGVLGDTGADASLVNLARAIKLYNTAANNYWDKNN